MKLTVTNPYNEYRVDGNCWNYTEAMFEDTSATNVVGPWFPPSADTVNSSLSVPVNKHTTNQPTSFIIIMTK